MAVAGGTQDRSVVRGASLLLRLSIYRKRQRKLRLVMGGCEQTGMMHRMMYRLQLNLYRLLVLFTLQEKCTSN